MNRAEFLGRLERGLRSLPAAKRTEILADYESYFVDGVAAGRDETQIAESLGSPARLIAELQLAHEAEAAPAQGARCSTLRALGLLLGIVVLNSAAWLPLLTAVLLVMILLAGGVVALVYGCWNLLVGPFDMPLGGVAAALLRGIGWLAAGIGALAIARAAVLVSARLFVRLQRRNRRVLGRAIDRNLEQQKR